eukprot:GEMP01052872.1.p1 GENE.GEMP01052872.1~~GEMP01052872.1.p1  ORF type:complete len:235 (+),score=39.87 GEMP01052872.1:90-794(+)
MHNIVQCISLSPPRQRITVPEYDVTRTQLRALNVPLMHVMSSPGKIEHEQFLGMRSTNFAKPHEERRWRDKKGCASSPTRILAVPFGSEEARPCMQVIGKEPAKAKVMKDSSSSSPLRDRVAAQHYVSIRSRISDESRGARIAHIQNYRETPGPGEYHSTCLGFGKSLVGGAPAVSRLQCFGTTEDRNCSRSKPTTRYEPILASTRPRQSPDVDRVLGLRSPHIRKGPTRRIVR